MVQNINKKRQENPLLYPSNLPQMLRTWPLFFAKGPKDLLMRMADRTENLEDGETRLFSGVDGW